MSRNIFNYLYKSGASDTRIKNYLIDKMQKYKTSHNLIIKKDNKIYTLYCTICNATVPANLFCSQKHKKCIAFLTHCDAVIMKNALE